MEHRKAGKENVATSRRYGHVIEMQQQELEQDTPRPQRFVWRGVPYRVRAIWATWHLRDRWWAGSGAYGEVGMPPASDRRYYRVQCTNGLLCDLYHDVVSDTWVLDRVLD